MISKTSCLLIAYLIVLSCSQNDYTSTSGSSGYTSYSSNSFDNLLYSQPDTYTTISPLPITTSSIQLPTAQLLNLGTFPSLSSSAGTNNGNTNTNYNSYSYSSSSSSTPVITSIPTTGTISSVVQNQTFSTVSSSIPLPNPIITDISNSAFGQITFNQSGFTQTQMYSPNCAEYVNGLCTKCSFRFVRASDGVCEPVNPLCATWGANGACLTCYSGYEICQSGCIMVESCAPSGTFDPNCRNTINGICQQCSFGYYFNQNGICTQVNPFCKTSNNDGNCLTCYAGYGLSNGNCTILPNPSQTNPYCARWANGVCQACSDFSWYDRGNCVSFDPMCARSDRSNGQCLGCYIGYFLSYGRCILNTTTQPSDLLCRRWNSAGVCVQCSRNSFLRQNMCVAVDTLCRTFDSINGFCLSCYAGYNLNNGRCVVIPPNSDYSNTNQYCSVWQGANCRQCAKNAYFNQNGICVPVNPYCATSSNGQCLSCYTGYILQNNNCTIDNSTINVGNALCSRWAGVVCQSCATRTFNRSGICTAVNTLCNTWDNYNGFCLSCYNGYILNGNTCVIDNQPVTNNPLCRTFSGSRCIQCSARSYFVNGICIAVDNNCATFNSVNGQCLSCYNGFFLQNARCIVAPVPQAPSVSTDIYCARNDLSGRCIRCFYGFTLQNGVCVADFKNTLCGKDPQFCKK